MLDLASLSWPTVALAGGAVLLAWSQVDRVRAWVTRWREAPKAESTLGPHELFERLYALRTWCQAAGQAEAVKALDTAVLPAIVQGGPKP